MIRTLYLSFVLLLVSISAYAQEVQVAFDRAGEMMVIDSGFARDARLFGDVTGFREARLFRDGNRFFLEISYVDGGQSLRRREELATADVDELRRRVDSYLELRRSSIDQSGRTYLLRRTAVMSYLVYGPSLAAALDVEGGAFTAVGLLAGSAGFFVPYLITRNSPVPMPAARMALAGSTLGYVHGIALSALVAGDDLSSRGLLGTALATSLGEAVAGYRFGLRTDIRDGHARLMTTGGWFGMGMGAMVGLLTVGDGDEIDDFDADAEIRLTGALSLLGSGAGIYIGHRVGRSHNYTLGDASVLATAGGVGLYTGLATAAIIDANLQSGMVATLTGTAAGIATGYALTRNTNFSESHANYIDLGTGAGFLLGSGVAQLVAEGDETAFMTASALGSLAGFAVMFATYRPEASAGGTGSSFRFEVAPVPGAWRPGLRMQHRW